MKLLEQYDFFETDAGMMCAECAAEYALECAEIERADCREIGMAGRSASEIYESWPDKWSSVSGVVECERCHSLRCGVIEDQADLDALEWAIRQDHEERLLALGWKMPDVEPVEGPQAVASNG